MNSVKIKVCGMRDAVNIQQLMEAGPDYMGFIFYRESARGVAELDKELMDTLSAVKKTAVFVNAPLEEILAVVNTYGFDAVQLHGKETPTLCKALKQQGLEVIKAFGIQDAFDWESLLAYETAVDYFLFDTFTNSHGGSGKTFNWDVLKNYTLSKPYFLSGGLGPVEVKSALEIKDERLYGLDLNSKFETSPGMKNIELLKTVLKKKNE